MRAVRAWCETPLAQILTFIQALDRTSELSST